MDLKNFIVEKEDSGFLVSNNKRSNPFYLKDNSYYSELAQLVEILKVEGTWNKKGAIAIDSKSPELINYYCNLFDDLRLKYSKLFSIKIVLDENLLGLKNLVVLENGKERTFHSEKNVFKKKVDRIAFSTSLTKATYELKSDNFSNKYEFSVSTQIFESSPNTYVYCSLRVHNKSFVTFLGKVLKDKKGTYEIRANKFLKKSSPSLIARVFGSVVDCEGSIRYSGLTRNIRLRMNNNSYLKDWQELLESISVKSHFKKRPIDYYK